MSDRRTGKQVKRGRSLAVTQETDLQKLFERFYRDKVAEGRSPNTLEQYENGWSCFQEYLGTLPEGTVLSVVDVTADLIRNYVYWLLTEKEQFSGNRFVTEKTKGLQPSSVNTRLKTLRVMFTHLYGNNVIEHSPVAKVKNVEEPEKPIEILTVEQMQTLLRMRMPQ